MLYLDKFGAMANLPSDEVIAQCATFYSCIAAAGGLFDLGTETGEPPAPTQAARDLFALLGVDENTETKRVAFNPQSDIDDCISEWKVNAYRPPAQEGGEGTYYLRTANLVEKGSFRLAYLIARKHCGLAGDAPSTPQAPDAPQDTNANAARFDALVEQVASLATATAAVAQGSVKDTGNTVSLKETISQVRDGVARRLTKEEVLECYARFQTQFG